MDKKELIKIAEGLEALKNKKKYNLYDFVFPEEGPRRAELYPKHIEFMNAGGKYAERMLSCGNQTGKTTTILWEAVSHAMLRYPKWWKGKKYIGATVGIIGAKSWEMIRDGIQAKLLGDFEHGTGLIPRDAILKLVSQPGTPGAYSQIHIKNNIGSTSKIIFKTYESRQTSWESMTVDYCFFDEEPPMEIYVEGSVRVMQRQGVTAIGFTPDSGLTNTVLHFFKDGKFSKGAADNKFIAMVGWDDVPHLTKEAKEAMLQKIPPYLREAKCKGLPYLGTGRVFQFDLEEHTVAPFEIPDYYEKFYGLDPGINNTAVVFIARDPDTQVMYVYDEYLVHNQPPQVVADAIKARGKWLEGAADPYYMVQRKALGSADVQNFLQIYKDLDLNIHLAERNTKESGIETLRIAFLRGRLKLFRTTELLQNQLNLYHRDDKGQTGRTPDDLIDALRYAITYGHFYAKSYASHIDAEHAESKAQAYFDQPRDNITGY